MPCFFLFYKAKFGRPKNQRFFHNLSRPATSIISDKIKVLLPSEKTIDETLPLDQILILGFAKQIRLGRNSRGGGTTLLIRDVPYKLLKTETNTSNTEFLSVEIDPCKKKWLI